MRVVLSDLVSFITVEESILQGPLKMRKYQIRLNFRDDRKQIMEKYCVSNTQLQEGLKKFTVDMGGALRKELRTKRQLVGTSDKKLHDTETEKEQENDTENEDKTSSNKKTKDNDSDSDIEAEEDGATAEKHHRQKKEISYNDDEDDEDKKIKNSESENEDNDDMQDNQDEGYDSGEKQDDEKTEISFDKGGYDFMLLAPLETRKILMLSLVETKMKRFVVKQVPHISRAMVTEESQKNKDAPKTYVIQTEGVNLRHMWQFSDIIKVDSIYCNDIWEILNTYGVEMARAAIMKEVKAVFNVYDIAVDWRHLGLIADFMTFRGGYKSFSKVGMAQSVSPLQKMSYESCGKYLSDAVVYGELDSLSATSSRIALGTMLYSGTGGFDLRVPVSPSVQER